MHQLAESQPVRFGKLALAMVAGVILLVLAPSAACWAQSGVALFDGRTFTGWEGDTNGTWRIEAGTITAGSPDRAVPRNEFLATTREFVNFELRLKFKIEGSAALNAGVQFRSQRIPNHHEVIGYQADIGTGVDGHLYDESRRNRMLATPTKSALERALRAVGPDGWHEYRISAIDQRILLWLNGVQTIEFTETDRSIANSGMIALQIHGGMKGTVAYKDIVLLELPSTPAATRLGPLDASLAPPGPFPGRRFDLATNDVVVFTGQTDLVRLRHAPALETLLAAHFARVQPRFRNMAWEGDTVYEQWRDLNFGTWNEQLVAARATVIIAQFGQIESMDGPSKLNDFIAAYEALLDQFEKRTRRVVLLSPHPFEPPSSSHMPDLTGMNDTVRAYTDAIRRLADRRGFVFVDLFTPLAGLKEKLTVNGMHLTPEAHVTLAAVIATSLGVATPALIASPALSEAIREKNRLWFDHWRPMNWSFAYGDRTEQLFGKPGGDRPALRIELEEFQSILAAAETQIHELADAVRLGRSLAPVRANPAVSSQRSDVRSAEPSATDHSPEAQRQSFTVAEGFAVNLFASEADGLIKPVQMRWDDAGRLWVLCTPTYPHIEPGAKPGDYLLVCADTDGDGRADRFTRFAEHLLVPMGLEFGDGGVYVAEGSELVHLRDTDGDGKADVRTVVLSGFGTGDTHQMINGLERGPGGELWFTQGHHVYSRVETPRGIARLEKAGVWRYRPRTGRLDGFFNLSTAGLNCQGVTHDDWGQTFHNSGAYSGGFYTSAGAIPTLRPLRYWAMAVPDRRNTGVEIIGTKHLPEEWQGCVVWGGFMGNSVQLHRLEDEGAGFTGAVLPDLLTSSRREFRPINVRIGPDGAIYVCDWYNPVIGHYQASYRDPTRDKTRGRIWRIHAKDRPVVTAPRFEGRTTAELLELLRSPERLTRHNAKTILFGQPTPAVMAALDAWVAALAPDDPQFEQLLVQAIGLCEGHETLRPLWLDRLLHAKDFRARAYGTRVIGNWGTRLPDPLAMLRRQIQDPHPRVRLEAIVACSYIPSAEAVAVATQALDQPRDRFIDYALAQAVHALGPLWYPALAQGTLSLADKPEHLRFVLESERTKETAGWLRQLAERPGLDAALRERILALLAAVGSGPDLRYALDAAPHSPAVLQELFTAAAVHHRKPTGDLTVPVRRLIAEPGLPLRAHGLALAGAWGVAEAADAVRAELARRDNDATVLVAALGATPALLGQETIRWAQPLAVSAAAPLPVRTAAIAALATVDLVAAARTVTEVLGGVTAEADVNQLLAPILNRKDGATVLTQAWQAKAPAADAARRTRQALNNSGRGDAALMNVLHQAMGIDHQPSTYDPVLVKSLAEAAMKNGDVRRGRTIFLSNLTSCSACHKLDGQGGEAGPDLTLVGAGRSPELLIESLLWPSRQIREGYMATSITTKAGDEFTGYKIRETPDEWQLRDPSANQVHRIAKADVEHMRDVGSLMPEGLTAGLSRDELHDLIRFLAEQGRVSPSR
ncbi:MAG: DUF1080 domain-containing protein [Verrucomicrobia bacterium]|nr:DUF1080 domain-containing protein [Verrucomicrobiota bacterium]